MAFTCSYKTTAGLAGLGGSIQAGVEGDSLVPAFSAPGVALKDYAISQTTRCRVSSPGISGNKYIEPTTAEKYVVCATRCAPCCSAPGSIFVGSFGIATAHRAPLSPFACAATRYYAACVRTSREEFGFMGYSLRTSDYRYTAWFAWLNSTTATRGPGPDLSSAPAGEELYDHRQDKAHYDVDNFEYENLADHPDYKTARDMLLGQLTKVVASWQTA